MKRNLIAKINKTLKEGNKTFSKEETKLALERVKKNHARLLKALKDA